MTRRTFMLQVGAPLVAGLGGIDPAVAADIAVSTSRPFARTFPRSVTDYGAKGDGVADDSDAFVRGLTDATGGALFVPTPKGHYKINETVTVPAGTYLIGETKSATTIKPGNCRLLFELETGAGLFNLNIDGNGERCVGVNISGRDGQQVIENCRIVNFDDTCLRFASPEAGSGFSCIGTTIFRKDGQSATGKFAIQIADQPIPTAVPRKFLHLETGGYAAISLGGSNSTYIANSFLGDVEYSTNTRATFISNCRLAGKAQMVVRGGQNTIVGCDVYPTIEIAKGTSGNVVGPNALNNPPVRDLSESSENLIYLYDATYSPALSVNGSVIQITGARVAGKWSRNGSIVSAWANLKITVPTATSGGNLRLSLPAEAPNQSDEAVCGQFRLVLGGRNIVGVCIKPAKAQWIEFHRDGDNSFELPPRSILAPGDSLQVGVSYSV